ncbi:hypothetical protein [Porticoccus sp.]
MAIYCVTYDLKAPGKDYSSVHRYLKTFTHCKQMESFWLLDTAKQAKEIRDELKSRVDSNDTIFVAELQKHWASFGYNCTDWLKDASRSW